MKHVKPARLLPLYVRLLKVTLLTWLGVLTWGGIGCAQIPQPAGLEFTLRLSYTPDGEILVFYTLSNVGETAFVVRPVDLRIMYGSAELPFGFTHSPAPGRANQLSPAESEFGSIVIIDPPFDSDNVQLVWPVFELGPNTHHTLLISFGEIMTAAQKDGRE